MFPPPPSRVLVPLSSYRHVPRVLVRGDHSWKSMTPYSRCKAAVIIITLNVLNVVLAISFPNGEKSNAAREDRGQQLKH